MSLRLVAQDISVGYNDTTIVHDVSLKIPDQKVTTIIGANGCGKSTLLRGLARMLPLQSGTVTLDDQDIKSYKHRDLAKQLSMLPQSPITPPGVTVAELVGRGRHPHQSWLHQWSSSHSEIVDEAMELTNVAELRDRPVTDLSGGQRQRVWISMVLAQDTDIVFLDEPTTYLDLAHSVEVLDLVRRLNKQQNKTIVMVLHDLNLASRYSDHLVLMKQGHLIAQGQPNDVISAESLYDVFGLRARVIPDPCAAGPLIVPEASEALHAE
ncbi:MAG: ABC transporter ATP-binding protein [Corynebacterium sp.]|nr:ABC transporter ATP-binding protein [Corynebacterium sp.]